MTATVCPGLAADRSDADLTAAAIAGDERAFEALYRRHAEAAQRLAMATLRNPDDARDAVAEAFTRVFRTLGAARAFRPYLLATVRNCAIDLVRRSHRLELAGVADEIDDRQPVDCVLADEDDRIVAEAFAQLPARWQRALWLIDVEEVSTAAAGSALGVSANNAAQLAARARGRLRGAYLQLHVPNHVRPRCGVTVAALGAFVAGTAPSRTRAKVEVHLAACLDCQGRVAELEDVACLLRRALPPLPVALLGLRARGPGRFVRGWLDRLWARTPGGMQGSRLATLMPEFASVSPILERVLAGTTAAVLAVAISTIAVGGLDGPHSSDAANSPMAAGVVAGVPSAGAGGVTAGGVAGGVTGGTPVSVTVTPGLGRDPNARDTGVLGPGPAQLAGRDLGRADLSGAPLAGADLTGASLPGANLSGADLTGALLGGVNLSGADLTGAQLGGASLAGAQLTGADLSGANLVDADLTRAVLAGADLSRSNLERASFSGAQLSGALLAGANLGGADLSHASLRDGNLVGAALNGSRLSDADLSGANLASADLTGAILNRVRLVGSDITSTRMVNSDLRGADLTGLDLGPADTRGARFGSDPGPLVAALRLGPGPSGTSGPSGASGPAPQLLGSLLGVLGSPAGGPVPVAPVLGPAVPAASVPPGVPLQLPLPVQPLPVPGVPAVPHVSFLGDLLLPADGSG